MPIRILILAIVSLLSGCVAGGIDLPKGVYISEDCGYGILPQSQPARCMSRAEYKTAKEKLRHSQDDASAEGGKEIDPRYKEWIP